MRIGDLFRGEFLDKRGDKRDVICMRRISFRTIVPFVADGLGKNYVEAAWKSGLQEAAISGGCQRIARIGVQHDQRRTRAAGEPIEQRPPVAGHVDLDRLWQAESRVGNRSGKDRRNDKDAEENPKEQTALCSRPLAPAPVVEDAPGA
ncbi:MAG: hypothetical protein WB663_17120 [Beijerinckiaceae bacterium]|jgi:hypothetical protein